MDRNHGQERWKGFLHRLHDDPDKAGERYNRLHARLEKYFQNNSRLDPCELADLTIDRLIFQLEKTPIPAAEIEYFAIGIARHIANERWRQVFRVWERLTAFFSNRVPERIDQECLEFSFRSLEAHDRIFIEAYYPAEKPTTGLSAHRQRLAEQTGLGYDALRKRASEIVRKLKAFYNNCRDNRLH
jgi:hypothetical protein